MPAQRRIPGSRTCPGTSYAILWVPFVLSWIWVAPVIHAPGSASGLALIACSPERLLMLPTKAASNDAAL